MDKYIICGKAGVYFLLDGDAVVYIGATSNFPRRIVSHYDKIFDRIRFIECDNRLVHEKRWINRFRPKYNLSTLSKEFKHNLRANGQLEHATSRFINY